MELIYLGVGVSIGFIIGFLVSKLMTKKGGDTSNMVAKELLDSAQAQITKLEKNVEQKEYDYNDVVKELAKQEQIVDNQAEKLANQNKELERLQEQIRLEFENTANRLLEEKSRKFTLQNQENLDSILAPLQEKLKTFSQKVEQYYNGENQERATLKEQIRNLTTLNQRMTAEAQNLTEALKGESKLQGNWGELLLERILEASGLRKDHEFFTQSHYTNEAGKHRYPDLVVHLPNERHIVIDSKMSLTAYERYCSETNEKKKEKALKEHLNSIKRHIDELSSKKYEQLYDLNSLDFVLMFIPLEAAFGLAMQHNHELFYKAFEKNVIVVSPMTLLATIRIVSNLWQQANQTKHAKEIARQGGLLYDKFVNFVQDLESIGKQIDKAKSVYTGAMNKLEAGKGNLIRRAEKLRDLGVNNSKKLSNKYLEE